MNNKLYQIELLFKNYKLNINDNILEKLKNIFKKLLKNNENMIILMLKMKN